MISSVERETRLPCLPSGSSPRQSRNLIKTEDSGGRQAAGTASASRGQPSGKIWRKKMEGSDFRERVMPTRAFCSFNPEWDIFHQERAETETDIYSSWYFSTLPLSLSRSNTGLTYLLGMKISEGSGHIQAEVIPAKTVLLAGPHGYEVVGDQLLVSSLKFMIILVSLSFRPNDIHKVLFYL